MVVTEGEDSWGGGDGYDHTILGKGWTVSLPLSNLEAASDRDKAGAQHARVVNLLEVDVLDRLVCLEESFELLQPRRRW